MTIIEIIATILGAYMITTFGQLSGNHDYWSEKETPLLYMFCAFLLCGGIILLKIF